MPGPEALEELTEVKRTGVGWNDGDAAEELARSSALGLTEARDAASSRVSLTTIAYPPEKLRDAIDLVVMFAVRELEHLVSKLGQPGRLFRNIDVTAVQQACFANHALCFGPFGDHCGGR